MTADGRKVRFELTPLEAEALAAYVAACLRGPESADPWAAAARKRGPGVISAALGRAQAKLREAVKLS